MRLLGTKLAANSSHRGFGDQLYDLSGQRPSLDLNFASNKSLVDSTTGQNLVSFTRASSGTYVDSQGVIRTATTNVIWPSENFFSWGVAAATRTADAGTAPNGTLTATRIESTGGGVFKTGISVVSGVSYTYSVYIKNVSGTGVVSSIGFERFGSVPLAGQSSFNLLTGTVVSNGAAVTASSITPVGDGWYRVSIRATSTDTTTTIINYAAASGNQFLLWGAQLEQSSTVGEYVKTTSTINSAPRFDHNPTTGESLGLLVEESRTNLLTYNEEFDSAGWAQPFLTKQITANNTVAPDGTLTADKMSANGVSAEYGIGKSVPIASVPCTASIYAKAGDSSFVYVRFYGAQYKYHTVVADLSSGAITERQTGTSVTGTVTDYIEYAGNGWYRISITANLGTAAAYLIVGPSNTGTPSIGNFGQVTLAGTGQSSYVWGAQLEEGAFSTSYIPTTTAAVTRSADVASISGSNFGVSRTNLLVRSEEFGDASWIKTRTSITDNATIAPNGTLTADKLVEDTSVTNNHLVYRGALALPSSTYTFSCFVKSAERSEVVLRLDTGGGQRVVNFNLASGSVGSATLGMQGSIVAVGGGWYRCIAALTVADTITNAVLLLAASGTTSYTGDGASGLFLWGAQLETGTTATAYIPTTSAAVTVVDSPWYRQDEGTVFSSFSIPTASTTGGARIYNISNSSNTTLIWLRLQGGTNRLYEVTDSSTQQAVLSAGTFSAGIIYRGAIGVKSNDFGFSDNGSSPTVDTSGSLGTVDRMGIGMDASGAAPFNGHLRRLTYWPQRLSNSALQSITQ